MNKKRGYEYEMMLARIDPRNAAIRISNLSLSSSLGYTAKHGIGFCGLNICAIRLKQTKKPSQAVFPISKNMLL
jgi:hypothetical protein